MILELLYGILLKIECETIVQNRFSFSVAMYITWYILGVSIPVQKCGLEFLLFRELIYSTGLDRLPFVCINLDKKLTGEN